jgi:hypothetical protein
LRRTDFLYRRAYRFWFSATNQVWGTAATGFTNVVPDLPDSLFDHYAPGIYKAVPYSMLVVVPGRVSDGGMVKTPPASDRMPIHQPEFKLIPRK